MLMKRNFIRFLLLMTAAVAALSITAAAEKDAVDRFADDLRVFQEEITVPVRDFDELMKETFARYPELYCYYAGCTYTSVADGLNISMTYRNTDVAGDEIYVVDSFDALVGALGLTMADVETESYIVLSGYVPESGDFDRAYHAVQDRFYLTYQGYYSYSYTSWDKLDWSVSYYEVELGFWEGTTREEVIRWRGETEQKVLELAGSLFAQDMPDWKKVLLIHDWLVDNNYYDLADFDKLQGANHCAYGTLAEGNGVCQSYSEAARMLCEAAGIPCYYIPGDGIGSDGTSGAHSWNCVELDGVWYLMDVTWDDPTTPDGSDVKRYDYFLISDDQMGQDHVWERGDYPACPGGDLNADKVLALEAADTNTYSEYSTELVRTAEIQRQELLALLGTQETLATVEEPVDEPEEPEEPADEPEEPSDQPEEPENEPEEPSDQPEEPTEEPEEPEDDLKDRLREVVPLKKEEGPKLSGGQTLLVVLLVLALCIGVTVIVIRCVAASRVRVARDDREDQRRRRVANSVRRRRRF